MRFLLDTNAFLKWTLNQKVPRNVQRIIERPASELLVSAVTGWEIVIKKSLGTAAFDIERGIRDMNAEILPIRFTHLDELSRLPLHDHRDPFDRMLIAQAIAEDVPLISSDTRFTAYKRLRVIWD